MLVRWGRRTGHSACSVGKEEWPRCLKGGEGGLVPVFEGWKRRTGHSACKVGKEDWQQCL